MLGIRKKQMAALEQSVKERLGREVLKDIWQSSPQSVQGLGKAEINERLAIALRKADGYQLQADRDLRAFVSLCFVVGPNFDEYPPLQTLLRSPETSSRMPSLFQGATEQDWTRAAVFDIVSRSRDPVPNDNSLRVANTPTRLEPVKVTPRSVSIRPLELEYAEPYFHQSLHPDVWRLASLKPLLCLEDTQRFIRIMQIEDESDGFAIIDASAGFVGAIFLDSSESLGQISYWVGRPFWGQGIATRATKELLRFLRQRTGLSRVTAAIACGNRPSMRVVEKCGFVQSSHDDGLPDIQHFSCDLKLLKE